MITMEARETMQNAIKSQTIGVEVEMYDITRENAAMVAARFFGTARWCYTGARNGYQTWSAWDGQGREWKFSRDCSIKARTDAERCEMVTPILKYADIELLQGLIRELRHAGAKSNPAHMCGVHIHIGAQGHTAKTLRNLVNIMASHEDLIVRALRLDRERLARYCQTVDEDFLRTVNAKRPQTMEGLADIWYSEHCAESDRHQHYNSSRYHMLNLHATFTKGTVEFRLFQFANPSAERKGGLHAGELKSYIQLCLAMSAAAKLSASTSPKKVQNTNQKYAMRTWLLRLGFIGEEFATARDILTKNLTGDAAYRNGRAA